MSKIQIKDYVRENQPDTVASGNFVDCRGNAVFTPGGAIILSAN